MRRVHKLSARKVETAKPGRYGDGQGLWLAVAETGACKWVFRFTWQRKVTETGLGSYPVVGLAEAREKAAAARKLVAAGTPILLRLAGLPGGHRMAARRSANERSS
jgi:Arm DNA-binding domain